MTITVFVAGRNWKIENFVENHTQLGECYVIVILIIEFNLLEEFKFRVADIVTHVIVFIGIDK